VQVFLRPAIALDLRAEVAVAFLLGIGLAGDDVQGQPPARELVEGGDLAREQGRLDEAGPVASRNAMCSVCAAACMATRKPSAEDEEYPTSAMS